MSEATASIRTALSPVAAVLLGSALLFAGHGLQMTLVPLRAAEEGFGNFYIGILGSSYYAGYVAGCLLAPYLILRSGHIRAFAAMMACLSAAALAFPLMVGEVSWLAFRFAFGFCLAGLTVIIESWLNDKATNTTRGTVMSTYIVISFATITAGQLGVTLSPISGFTLFTICSILLSLAAVPVALTTASQPAPIPVVSFRPRAMIKIAPAGFVGAFVSGLCIGSVFSLSAIFAIDSGFSANEAAGFASAIVIGGAIGQYPFGRASDLIDRRLVLLIAVVAAIAVSIPLMFAPAFGQMAVLALGFLLGIAILPIYSIAAAHAFDWSEQEQMVEVSAGLLLLFGLGSTIGPLIASVFIEFFGPAGLFLQIIISLGALTAFIAGRLFARSRPTEEQRSDFDIYSTAPVGGALTPEPIPEDAPEMEMPSFPTLADAEPTEDEERETEPTIDAAHDDVPR